MKRFLKLFIAVIAAACVILSPAFAAVQGGTILRNEKGMVFTKNCPERSQTYLILLVEGTFDVGSCHAVVIYQDTLYEAFYDEIRSQPACKQEAFHLLESSVGMSVGAAIQNAEDPCP